MNILVSCLAMQKTLRERKTIRVNMNHVGVASGLRNIEFQGKIYMMSSKRERTARHEELEQDDCLTSRLRSHNVTAEHFSTIQLNQRINDVSGRRIGRRELLGIIKAVDERSLID